MTHRPAGFVAIVALLLLPPSAAAAAAPATIEQCLRRDAEAHDFSGIVSIRFRGRPAAEFARGRLGGDGSAAIALATRFNLASAGKMFTAIAVAQLVEAGKAGLDDPIGRHVAGLTAETSRVTIRQLLTHSSGLGNYFSPDTMAAVLAARRVDDLLALVAAEKPAFPPGSRLAYSNSGFVLLGALVERLSGLAYGDYLSRHVFAPAGMRRTGTNPRPLSELAVGMSRGPGGKAPLHPAPGATTAIGSPAGGHYGSAGDLHGFLAAVAKGRLTRPMTAAAWTSPQIEGEASGPDSPKPSYGFGFGTGRFEGHRWFGHNGGSLGANVEAAAFPDDGWSLVILANRDPPAATRLFRYARELIFHPERRRDCAGPVQRATTAAP